MSEEGSQKNWLNIIKGTASRDPSREPRPANAPAPGARPADPNAPFLGLGRPGASREPSRGPAERAPANPAPSAFPNSWRPDSSRTGAPVDPFRAFASKPFSEDAQSSRSNTQSQHRSDALQTRLTGTRRSPDPLSKFMQASNHPPAGRDPPKIPAPPADQPSSPSRIGQPAPTLQPRPPSRGFSTSNPGPMQEREAYSREASRRPPSESSQLRPETFRPSQPRGDAQPGWGRSGSNSFDGRRPEEPGRSKGASPSSTLQNSFVRNSLHFEEKRNLTGNRSLIQEKFREGSRREFLQQLQELDHMKRNWLLFFFFVLAFLVLWFGMAYLRTHSGHKLPFCDSSSFDAPDGCRPCPELANCRGGQIVSCDRSGYIIVGDQCMQDDATIQAVHQEVVTYLSNLRGQAECDEPSLVFKKTRSEIQDYLASKFKNKQTHYTSIGAALNELPNSYDRHSYSPIEVQEEPYGRDVYFAKTATHPLGCSLRRTVSSHKYVFSVGLLLLALAFLKVDGLKREIERRKRGEQYYQYIEGLLQQAHNHQMFEEEIKKHLRVHFSKSKSEIDDVFNYVMSAAFKSEKIDYAKKSENGIEQRVWWMDV